MTLPLPEHARTNDCESVYTPRLKGVYTGTMEKTYCKSEMTRTVSQRGIVVREQSFRCHLEEDHRGRHVDSEYLPTYWENSNDH